MTIDEPFPASWGRTTIATLTRDPDGTWSIVESWLSLVFPGEDGEIRHGSRDAALPDTVAIAFEEMVVANGDLRAFVLDNLHAYDAEYYLALRLREVLDPARWAATPWKPFVPGQLVHAWDKFHYIEYFRRPGGDAEPMSYGGDWAHLEGEFNAELPPPAGAPASPPTESQLLAAIESDDLPRVKDLLARGADPNAGDLPPGVTALERDVSHARGRRALWDAVMHASPSITEALLAAGARVDYRPPDGMTALHGAILNRRFAHVAVLLQHGADPTLAFRNETAMQMAEREDPETARLLRDWRIRDRDS